MAKQPRWLVLVICPDAELAVRYRQGVRALGYLAATARNPEAAIALFHQIRVDALLLTTEISASESDRLCYVAARLPRLSLIAIDGGGWTHCAEEELARELAEGLPG